MVASELGDIWLESWRKTSCISFTRCRTLKYLFLSNDFWRVYIPDVQRYSAPLSLFVSDVPVWTIGEFVSEFFSVFFFFFLLSHGIMYTCTLSTIMWTGVGRVGNGLRTSRVYPYYGEPMSKREFSKRKKKRGKWNKCL